jgi:hypothetical protein
VARRVADAVTLLEVIEDAFFATLEEGAIPPREFSVRIPKLHTRDDGSRVRICGYTLVLLCDWQTEPEWVH